MAERLEPNYDPAPDDHEQVTNQIYPDEIKQPQLSKARLASDASHPASNSSASKVSRSPSVAGKLKPAENTGQSLIIPPLKDTYSVNVPDSAGIASNADTSHAATSDATTSHATTSDAGTSYAPISDADTSHATTSDAGTSYAPISDADTSHATTSDAGTSHATTSEPAAKSNPNNDAGRQYFIKVNARSIKYVVKSGDTVPDIARRQLGPGASQKDVELQASLIAQVNSDGPYASMVFRPHPGDTLLLPGHTRSGDILVKDHWGTLYSSQPDGTTTVTYTDGTGFKRSVDKDGNTVKTYFGPSVQDDYTVKLDRGGMVISNDRIDPLHRQAGKLVDERVALEKLVSSKMSIAAERKEFEQRMREFEQRAKVTGMPDKEVAQTYTELSRILSLKGTQPLTGRERQRMALGIITGAAEPTNNDQGYYSTCSMSAGVENRLYMTEPSTVARTLADIAARGKYVLTTGTIVRMEPDDLRAHGEAALNEPPGLDCRTYASQVFELAAANAYFTEWNENAVPPQEIRYSNVKPSNRDGDTGERLINYRTAPPQIEFSTAPGNASSVDGVIRTYYLVSGKYLPDTFLVNKKSADISDQDGNMFQTKDELKAKLFELKQQGELPATIAIKENSDLIFHLHQKFGGTLLDYKHTVKDNFINDGHFVNIVDFNEKTNEIKVANTWGKGLDWLKHPLTLDQLFEATHSPECATWLERIQQKRSSEPESRFAEQLENVMLAYIDIWRYREKQGLPYDQGDAERSRQIFRSMLSTLNPSYAMRVSKQVDTAWNTWDKNTDRFQISGQ